MVELSLVASHRLAVDDVVPVTPVSQGDTILISSETQTGCKVRVQAGQGFRVRVRVRVNPNPLLG